MHYCNIAADQLLEFTRQTFVALGYSEEDANRAASVLHYADLRGHDTHGVANLENIYVNGSHSGDIRRDAVMTFSRRNQATANLDAGGGLGLLAGQVGMQEAIDLAIDYGIACVTVNNSSHFGAAGFYSEMAARQGLLGLSMTNLGRDPVAFPSGSQLPLMGTNPIGMAAGDANGDVKFSLDMSTSIVASGKVRQAARRGEVVPSGWLYDAEGKAVADPIRYLDKRSAYLPMLGGIAVEHGAHKGLGLGLMVEILCGALAGAQTVADIGTPGRNAVGHCFIAIDPCVFGTRDAFDMALNKLTDHISNAPMHPGFSPLQMPGAPEVEIMALRAQKGIPLDTPLFSQLLKMAKALGITAPKMEQTC